MMEQDRIKAFFTDQRKKLVSVKGIEEMAGVPMSTLKNFLNGQRGLPDHHLKRIVNVLVLLGYQKDQAKEQFVVVCEQSYAETAFFRVLGIFDDEDQANRLAGMDRDYRVETYTLNKVPVIE